MTGGGAALPALDVNFSRRAATAYMPTARYWLGRAAGALEAVEDQVEPELVLVARFATVINAMTMPVTTHSEGFCPGSMRPGSPMTRAASKTSRTTGTAHLEFTRYCAGSATCLPAATRIASATGHKCSLRPAAAAVFTAAPRKGDRRPWWCSGCSSGPPTASTVGLVRTC